MKNQEKLEKLAQGAEAVIFLDKAEGIIIKKRIKKDYRISEIDDNLRKTRTRREAKVIEKMPVARPGLIAVDDKEMTIKMDYIKGPKLRDILSKNNFRKIAAELGKKIGLMHGKGIIHGDLTTSNMIFSAERNEIVFIDFGLSFFSHKTEDKAVDLHLLRQALESKHYELYSECFKAVLENYPDKEVIKRLSAVESRGRNKTKGHAI